MNGTHLDYLLTVYDNSIRNSNVHVCFTREELERQYFVNELAGKSTLLSAVITNKYEWQLKIIAC